MVKQGKTPSAGVRLRQATRRQGRRQAKKEASQLVVPSSFNLIKQVFGIFLSHWQVLGGIILIYLILSIVLASGLSSVVNNFDAVKNDLASSRSLSAALGGFSSLLGGSAAGSSPAASVMQNTLIVIGSLVTIWALRQLLIGQQIGIKEAYYRSMTPLIPFVLVLLVIFIQLLPVTIGSGLLAAVASSFPGSDWAILIMSLVLALLAAWSAYMLSSSIFALYIVTLPDTQPRQALRTAKNLVNFRRLKIIRRVLFLPVFILLAMAVIIVPLVLFAQVLVVPIYYLLSILVLFVAHTYLYSLYRGLLDDQ
ncbi:hypothetical protein HYW36_00705 [Candidatus Saccharibacteria bacterium]|nr:hypothetical protein [Candidatus Saccharibacteria bacterium]